MQGKTVLVVDDSRAEQRLIEAILSQAGLTVVVVNNAEQALDWMDQSLSLPDLMVVDVMMPGINGFELCRQLRARPDTQDIPIVFCTSKDQDFDRFWGLRQGGNAYITKPFAPNDLLNAVRDYILA